MNKTNLAPGQTYRLLINFEVHDEATGTLRELVRKGSVVKIRRIAADQGRVWLEGHEYPFPLWSLEKQLTAAN